jgi:hypothetical protein
VVPDEKLAATQAVVTVESNGRRLRAESDSGVPATNLTDQRENLLRKFLAIATPVIHRENAQRLADTVLHADEIAAASDLIAFTRPA